MNLYWHWPWQALIALLVCVALIALLVMMGSKPLKPKESIRVFSLKDDLDTEKASQLFRTWHTLCRAMAVFICLSLLVSLALLARPSQVDEESERQRSRDIVLCLDVSGSTLPYDREVIRTYLRLVSDFRGERIGLTIFDSTARTVFPLTDDYGLVSKQLKNADRVLKGVQSQDDIDEMKERQYQEISDWLEGTQNRKDVTSLIGDGVVSCAAMLPGFIYGTPTKETQQRQRAASIVLATDNVLSGKPTYSLKKALDLTTEAGIGVDGLYSGPLQSEKDQTTLEMKSQIQSHGGTFLTQTDGSSVNELVMGVERRRNVDSRHEKQTAVTDAPGWWVLALAILLLAWIPLSWRLRR